MARALVIALFSMYLLSMKGRLCFAEGNRNDEKYFVARTVFLTTTPSLWMRNVKSEVKPNENEI